MGGPSLSLIPSYFTDEDTGAPCSYAPYQGHAFAEKDKTHRFQTQRPVLFLLNQTNLRVVRCLLPLWAGPQIAPGIGRRGSVRGMSIGGGSRQLPGCLQAPWSLLQIKANPEVFPAFQVCLEVLP